MQQCSVKRRFWKSKRSEEKKKIIENHSLKQRKMIHFSKSFQCWTNKSKVRSCRHCYALITSQDTAYISIKKLLLQTFRGHSITTWTRRGGRGSVETKGQIISKRLLVSWDSSKKRTNKFVFSTVRQKKTEFVRSFFGRIRGYQKSFWNYLTFSIFTNFSWAKSHNFFIMQKSKFTKIFNICWKRIPFMLCRISQFEQMLYISVNFDFCIMKKMWD